MSSSNSTNLNFEALKKNKITELTNKYNKDSSDLARLYNNYIINLNNSTDTDDNKIISINKLINECNYQKNVLQSKLNNDILEIQNLLYNDESIKLLESIIINQQDIITVENPVVNVNNNTDIINKINNKINKLLEYYNKTIEEYNNNNNNLNLEITKNSNELSEVNKIYDETYNLINECTQKISDFADKIIQLEKDKKSKIEIIQNLNKNININNSKIKLLKNKLDTNINKSQNIKLNNVLDENDISIIDDDISINDNEINLNTTNLEKVELTKSVMNFSNKNIKKALIYGINYLNTPYKLSGCLNDAQEVKKLLLSSNFKEENINLFDDSNKSIRKPTRKNILEDFTNLIKSGNSGDELFFYYSGHGSNISDKNGDENDGYDEMIIPCDLNPIVDDELKEIIKDHLKENVTLIALFDCCFSGSVLDLKYQYLDSLNRDRLTVYPKELETKGNVIMISGCADNQTSSECLYGKIPRGAMTVAFRIVFGNNNKVTWRQLVKGMRDLLKRSSFRQIPQLSSGKFINIDSQVFI